MSNRVEDLDTIVDNNSSWIQTADSIVSTVSKKVENLKIGAKNILRGTQQMKYVGITDGWSKAGFYTSGSSNGTVTYYYIDDSEMRYFDEQY